MRGRRGDIGRECFDDAPKLLFESWQSSELSVNLADKFTEQEDGKKVIDIVSSTILNVYVGKDFPKVHLHSPFHAVNHKYPVQPPTANDIKCAKIWSS